MQNTPANLLARRAGLIAFVLVIVVFGSELTLSQLRRRDITVSVQVNTATPSASATQSAAPTVTPAPDQPAVTPTPGPAVLIIAPNDQLLINVQWNYKIGPRFPRTVVRATSKIDGRSVGEAQVVIDCGSALLDCSGSQPIRLNYTVSGTGSSAQTVPWPVGDYVVVIERSVGELQYTPIQQTEFHVR